MNSGHSFVFFSGHSKCIRTAFETHSSGNLKIPTAFKVHSGHSCPLVGTFQLHSSRIRAAIEGQSKDSDGIRSAFQLDSLITENIEIDSHSFEVHSGVSRILVGTFQLHSSRIRAAIEGQSRDSDGIRSASQLDSLST